MGVDFIETSLFMAPNHHRGPNMGSGLLQQPLNNAQVLGLSVIILHTSLLNIGLNLNSVLSKCFAHSVIIEVLSLEL